MNVVINAESVATFCGACILFGFFSAMGATIWNTLLARINTPST